MSDEMSTTTKPDRDLIRFICCDSRDEADVVVDVWKSSSSWSSTEIHERIIEAGGYERTCFIVVITKTGGKR